MRHFLAVLAAILLLLSLIGCKDDSPQADAEFHPATKATTAPSSPDSTEAPTSPTEPGTDDPNFSQCGNCLMGLITCHTCSGSGEVMKSVYIEESGNHYYIPDTCSNCNGIGMVPCPDCDTHS